MPIDITKLEDEVSKMQSRLRLLSRIIADVKARKKPEADLKGAAPQLINYARLRLTELESEAQR